MSDNDEFIREFLEESSENLDLLDQDFVALESNPDDEERLANVFRTIHTIKGTSGFFNFSKLGAIAHAGENLLGLLRDGTLWLDQEITSALLQCVDSIREVLTQIEQTGAEGSGDYRALNERLTLLAKKQQAPRPSEPIHSDEASMVMENDTVGPDPVADSVIENQILQSQAKEPVELIPPVPTLLETEVVETSPPQEATSSGRETHATSAGGSVRVDVRMLDDLMSLVGELVLARNQLLQFSTTIQDRNYQSVTQRVNQITSDLQEGIMKTRMQPIGSMWSKFPRVVRDLAVSCKKEVRLVMEGQDTELDRTLLEAIKDPLTHLIRNSIDHGIETPEQRRRIGKNPEGTLLLRSFHEGGLVNIEITDDGGGISVERVRDRALRQGILTPEQSHRWNSDELVQLIFRPGFSTAEQVSDVSGRGVGMDVVRTNIERIGGSIELKNHPGHGTTVSVKIPLTLAIIPAMMVTCCNQSFAIPQASVVELLSLCRGESKRFIETIHETPVVRLRGQILPLVVLAEQLQLCEARDMRDSILAQETVEVIVLQADQLRFGLVVDSIRNAEEIVVKPLDPLIGALRVYSGATIMGDGNVTLILDITGIASRCISDADLKHVSDAVTQPQPTESTTVLADASLLLCSIDHETYIAIPLDQIRRLEEIGFRDLERSASGDVVQCRGEILPIVHLGRALGRNTASSRPANESRPLPVIVSMTSGKEIGLVVDRILDVVSCPTANRTSLSTPGLLGQAIINNRVTDIVDIPRLLNQRVMT